MAPVDRQSHHRLDGPELIATDATAVCTRQLPGRRARPGAADGDADQRARLKQPRDADTFGGAHGAHLRSCQPCRTTTNQFAAITDFAHTNALAPSPHFARSLALIVAGFSAPPSTAPPHD